MIIFIVKFIRIDKDDLLGSLIIPYAIFSVMHIELVKFESLLQECKMNLHLII